MIAGDGVHLVGAGPGDPGPDHRARARLLEQARSSSTTRCPIRGCCAMPRTRSTSTSASSGGALVHAGTDQRAAGGAWQRGKARRAAKGGDPFVFGRGGEECEALQQRGRARSKSSPASPRRSPRRRTREFPVTHRDFNSSFTLITGHEKEEEYKEEEAASAKPAAGSSDIDWASIAKLPCIAFYMGVKSLPRITAEADRARNGSATRPRRRSSGGRRRSSGRSSAPSRRSPQRQSTKRRSRRRR